MSNKKKAPLDFTTGFSEQYVSWFGKVLAELENEMGIDPAEYPVTILQTRAWFDVVGRRAIGDKEILCVIQWDETDIVFNTTIRPFTFHILTESSDGSETSYQVAFELFRAFAQKYDEYSYKEDGDLTRHSYSDPTIAEPFERVDATYRAYAVMGASVTTVRQIANLDYLFVRTSDGDEYTLYDPENGINNILSYTISYAGSFSTEQVGTPQLAQSVNTAAVVTMSIVIPPEQNTFVHDLASTALGVTPADAEYVFRFSVFGVMPSETGELGMKLSSFVMNMDSEENPTYNLVFQR